MVQDRTKELTSEIMQRVHFRNDVFDVMTWQLACGCTDACMTNEWRTATYHGGLGGATDVRFTTEAYNQLVKKTLANTVTLGLYSNLYSDD